MKTTLHSLAAFCAACLAPLPGLVAGPSALVNPGFEEVLGDNGFPLPPWPDPLAGSTLPHLPGWANYRPNSGNFPELSDVWSINGPNLAGFAQAFLIDGSEFSYEGWPPPPMEGRFAIGLISSYPADATLSRDPWTGQPYGTTKYIGQAGIAQSVGLPADVTELTCYYADLRGTGFNEGSLVLKFNQQVLGYTLEPAVGPNGPTTLLRADLTPVAGQYGELRIGIEGRGFFVVDSIVVVPEASTVAGALLVVFAMAAGLARPDRRHCIGSPSPDPAAAALSPQASAQPRP